MTEYDNYFTTYEGIQPPEIIPDDTKDIFIKYKRQDDLPLIDYSQPIKQESDNYSTPILDYSQVEYKSSNSLGNSIVDTARQFIGTKYSWGGSTPSTGFDCSGLVQYAFKQNGINLPRTVKKIEKVGSSISLQDAQPGDLICLSSTGPSGKHIKIVSKIDNGQIYTIDARGKKLGIIESPLTDTSKITSIRRITQPMNNNNIVDYFINKGLTRNQAKGIYGNLMQESGGNINITSRDGHNSYGLAQWTGERKQRLFNMFGTKPNQQQQLDFLWWELNNTHKSALSALKNTTTVSDATKVFMNKFERPNSKYANFNNRLRYANSV